eukprot:UN27184
MNDNENVETLDTYPPTDEIKTDTETPAEVLETNNDQMKQIETPNTCPPDTLVQATLQGQNLETPMDEDKANMETPADVLETPTE